MAKNPRFQVSDNEDELKKLEAAIKKLGYKNKGDWYRDMKRRTLREAQKIFGE